MLDGFWMAVRNSAATPGRRQASLKTARSLVRLTPFTMLSGAGPAEAIRAVEGLRHHLAAGLHAPVLPEDNKLPEETVASYRHVAAAYEQAQRQARERLTSESIATAAYEQAQRQAQQRLVDEERVAAARDEMQRRTRERQTSEAPAATALSNLVTEIEQIQAVPGYEWFGKRPRVADLAKTLPEKSIAVYLLAGNDTGAALLLDPEGHAEDVPLPGLTWDDAIDKADSLLAGSAEAQAVAEWAGRVLEPLCDCLQGDERDWILIPTGYLALLPWHAARDASGKFLDDQHVIRTLPGLLHEVDTDRAAATGPAVIGIYADDLLFVDGDLAVSRHYLPDATVLDRAGVSPEDVLRHLREAPFAVLSGHAAQAADSGSGLVFRRPSKDPAARDYTALTADLVQRLPPLDRDLAILASCSSGQIALELPDETLGLPDALLEAGFSGVCATMWEVNDAVAFLTLARFLQLRHDRAGEPPAVLLRDTRHWLRCSTAADLRAWLSDLDREVSLPNEVQSSLLALLSRYAPTGTPFDDPADWAAFTYIGR